MRVGRRAACPPGGVLTQQGDGGGMTPWEDTEVAWVCREGSEEEKKGQDQEGRTLASSHSWTRILLEV